MRSCCWCILLFLVSCGTGRMTETSLYFGQSIPGGGIVSATEWNAFRENYIRKVFTEGSTVISVTGNWYDTAKGQLITEPTYIVQYYHPRSGSLSRRIDSLRYWYKTLFRQQSVLRVDKKVRASF